MNRFQSIIKAFKTEPYITVNSVLAVVIIMIIIYSLVFSPARGNYPVTCIHEKITGKPCISCGLSHSFSLILRGRINEAYSWNPYGMRVFIFFMAQLIMRIIFSVYYLKSQGYHRQLIIYDIAGSVLTFLIVFLPFLRYIFNC